MMSSLSVCAAAPSESHMNVIRALLTEADPDPAHSPSTSSKKTQNPSDW